MEIDNLLTKIEEGSSSMLAVLATIRNSAAEQFVYARTRADPRCFCSNLNLS